MLLSEEQLNCMRWAFIDRPPGHTVSDFNSLFIDKMADVIGRPKNLIMYDNFNIDSLSVIESNYMNESDML